MLKTGLTILRFQPFTLEASGTSFRGSCLYWGLVSSTWTSPIIPSMKPHLRKEYMRARASGRLFLHFQQKVILKRKWRVSGLHYARTEEACFANLDASRRRVWPVCRSVYPDQTARLWFHRWRLSFLSCAKLFSYRKGREWWVAQYSFKKR